jgi:hypothetical protein
MEALELEDTITNYEQHDADGWCVMTSVFANNSLCQTVSVCRKLIGSVVIQLREKSLEHFDGRYVLFNHIL